MRTNFKKVNFPSLNEKVFSFQTHIEAASHFVKSIEKNPAILFYNEKKCIEYIPSKDHSKKVNRREIKKQEINEEFLLIAVKNYYRLQYKKNKRIRVKVIKLSNQIINGKMQYTFLLFFLPSKRKKITKSATPPSINNSTSFKNNTLKIKSEIKREGSSNIYPNRYGGNNNLDKLTLNLTPQGMNDFALSFDLKMNLIKENPKTNLVEKKENVNKFKKINVFPDFFTPRKQVKKRIKEEKEENNVFIGRNQNEDSELEEEEIRIPITKWKVCLNSDEEGDSFQKTRRGTKKRKKKKNLVEINRRFRDSLFGYNDSDDDEEEEEEEYTHFGKSKKRNRTIGSTSEKKKVRMKRSQELVKIVSKKRKVSGEISKFCEKTQTKDNSTEEEAQNTKNLSENLPAIDSYIKILLKYGPRKEKKFDYFSHKDIICSLTCSSFQRLELDLKIQKEELNFITSNYLDYENCLKEGIEISQKRVTFLNENNDGLYIRVKYMNYQKVNVPLSHKNKFSQYQLSPLKTEANIDLIIFDPTPNARNNINQMEQNSNIGSNLNLMSNEIRKVFKNIMTYYSDNNFGRIKISKFLTSKDLPVLEEIFLNKNYENENENNNNAIISGKKFMLVILKKRNSEKSMCEINLVKTIQDLNLPKNCYVDLLDLDIFFPVGEKNESKHIGINIKNVNDTCIRWYKKIYSRIPFEFSGKKKFHFLSYIRISNLYFTIICDSVSGIHIETVLDSFERVIQHFKKYVKKVGVRKKERVCVICFDEYIKEKEKERFPEKWILLELFESNLRLEPTIWLNDRRRDEENSEENEENFGVFKKKEITEGSNSFFISDESGLFFNLCFKNESKYFLLFRKCKEDEDKKVFLMNTLFIMSKIEDNGFPHFVNVLRGAKRIKKKLINNI